MRMKALVPVFFVLAAARCSSGGGGAGGSSMGVIDGGSAKGDGGGPSNSIGKETTTPGGIKCAAGYTCTQASGKGRDVVWVMKNDGNVNGPNCQQVCEQALPNNCAYHACDEGRAVEYPDLDSFKPLATELGFKCKKGDCWPEAPGEGMYMVSIKTDDSGTKSCYFPDEKTLSCSNNPGNANCFGERYALVCPCVTKPLNEACQATCPPYNTTRAVWKTEGTSCLERINYWRKRACEEGWVECPPAGLPPMVECTACHACTNSEAAHDAKNGAHASFTRCGENAQGEGGGANCAAVIDGFVSERAPDKNGIMRCEGHCGPILAPGCRSVAWGRDKTSGFHTLNWGGCNAEKCQAYCNANAGACYTVETSPSLQCEVPGKGEANPVPMSCK
jgi:hypothetical protein